MYPQTECINKVWYIYTIDFLPCERIFMPFTGKVMQQVMLNEFNQSQKDKYHIYIYLFYNFIYSYMFIYQMHILNKSICQNILKIKGQTRRIRKMRVEVNSAVHIHLYKTPLIAELSFHYNMCC